MVLSHTRAVLGRTGLEVGRLGVSASYGVPAAAVERAFERGVNYLYWGSARRSAFAHALRNLAPHRSRLVLVVQSYSRIARLIGWSVERALRALRFDHADVLLLGYWNSPIPARILDAAREAQRRGLVRHLAASTHKRVLVPRFDLDVVHFRYNAMHTGAERDIFPHLGATRPGLVSFTATDWGKLIRRGVSAADCYRFALARPEIDVCMTGPASAAHMEEALRALELPPLSPEELARIRAIGDRLYGKPR